VFALDRFQATDAKHLCQNDPRHGTLWPHKSGAALTCGFKGCEYAEPVSNDLLSRALALK